MSKVFLYTAVLEGFGTGPQRVTINRSLLLLYRITRTIAHNPQIAHTLMNTPGDAYFPFFFTTVALSPGVCSIPHTLRMVRLKTVLIKVELQNYHTGGYMILVVVILCLFYY